MALGSEPTAWGSVCSHVVFAYHGPVALLSQVLKLRQKQQEDNGLPQKDTEDLSGEFSLMPRVCLTPKELSLQLNSA